MLVLARRPQEEIIIDGDIRVIVVAVYVAGRKVPNASVRLGIEAPDSVSVNRLEIEVRKDVERRTDGYTPHHPTGIVHEEGA